MILPGTGTVQMRLFLPATTLFGLFWLLLFSDACFVARNNTVTNYRGCRKLVINEHRGYCLKICLTLDKSSSGLYFVSEIFLSQKFLVGYNKLEEKQFLNQYM
jgi:hypothetical protein